MGLFGRRKAAEQALSEARAQLGSLQTQLRAVAGERDELQAERDLLRGERDELRATVKRQDDEIAAAGTAAEAAAVREAARVAALAEGAPAASWPLVLADMQRRWANTVGVQPADRAMKATEVPGQISEALDREVERVREEVGCDVSITINDELPPTADPVVFLLAATDLLGAMVSTCEKVAIELGDGLVMVGEVWSDLGDDIEVSRQRAVDAGLQVDPVEVGEESVRVRLAP